MANEKPAIGIVTTRLPSSLRVDGRRVLRPAAHFCRIAQAANKLGGTVLLFIPQDVDWHKETVLAWTPVDASSPFADWVRRRVPLPTVIYENVYVHLAVQGYSAALRTQAKTRRIPLFNPVMPGKWQMARLLQNSDCKSYMPTTDRLDDVRDAIHKIRRWGMAYVKPSGGYGGNGVMRVECLADGRYRVSVDRVNGRRKEVREILSEAALERRLRHLKATPHLVQRGIDLMTVGGRKLDFRVVVHRDGQGHWGLVGIVPKQAAKDGVVTNLVAGGEQLSLDQSVQKARREAKTIPVAQLEECALRIAELLSERNNHVALVGFDLGVDKDGKVWIIEMNPKPARSLMTQEMRDALARQQAAFALYLAKQRHPARA